MARVERAALEAAILAHWLAAEGYRSSVLAFTDNAYGRTAEATFANVWRSLGLELTDTVQIGTGLTDYSAPIALMSAAGGSAMVVLGEIGPAAQQRFLSGLTDSGGFDTLVVTSPWFDAAFGQASSRGLDVYGLSMSGQTPQLLTAVSGQVTTVNTTISSLNGSELQPVRGLQVGLGTTADVFIGQYGPDSLFGRAGADTLSGGGWRDHLDGGSDVDVLFGGSGTDQLFGGSGNDTLLGDTGSDTLQGDSGNDQLFGGLGGDRFIFGASDGRDRLADFSISARDRLMLDDALWNGGLTRAEVVDTYGSVTSAGVLLNFGNGDSVTFVGLTTLVGLELALGFF